MLRTIGVISISLLVSFCSFTQNDSLRVVIDEKTRKELSVIPPNCHHGHICCAAGCHCCTELHRDQEYDTLDIERFDDGSTRSIIQERHMWARSHEMSSMKYLFKDSTGKVTGKYFIPPSIVYFHSSESALGGTADGNAPNPSEQVVFDAEKIYHLINEKGEELAITDYTTSPLNDNLNRVSIFLNGIRIDGIMNAEGQLLHRGFGYSYISDFNGDAFAHVTETSGASNLINRQGELLLKESFVEMEDLTHGFIKVHDSHGWRLLDANGRKLNNMAFDDIGRYSDGMFWVRKKSNYGFLNTEGKLVAKVKYERTWPFSSNRAAVSLRDKWGFIDKTGKVVIPIQYDDICMFGDGLAGVATGTNPNTDVWNLIDSMGNLVTKQVFDEIHPFNGGYAVVSKKPYGQGIIDTSGNIVVECKYDTENHNIYYPWEQTGTVLLVDYENSKNPKAIIWNLKTGESIRLKNASYGSRARITNKLEWLTHYIVSNKANEKGMVDFQGNELIEIIYDELYVLDATRALAIKGDKMYIYNFTDGTKELFVHGTLTQIPSKGYFRVKDIDGTNRGFDYDGNDINRL
jgi:hypothetical protein